VLEAGPTGIELTIRPPNRPPIVVATHADADWSSCSCRRCRRTLEPASHCAASRARARWWRSDASGVASPSWEIIALW